MRRIRYATALGLGAMVMSAGLVAPAAAAGAAPVAPAKQAVTGVPDASAPHTTKVIPGLTGAALAKVLPAGEEARFRTTHSTLAAKSGNISAPSSTSGASSIEPWEGEHHPLWGPTWSAGYVAVQATHSLNPKLSNWDNDSVYAPTLYPGGAATIELTTLQWSNGSWIAAWDWGHPELGFNKLVLVSDLPNYVTNIEGHAYYSMQIVRTNAAANTWVAYLYNYVTHAWDIYYTSSNSAKIGETTGGWVWIEMYTHYNAATGQGNFCTDTYSYLWRTRGLKFQTSSGAWQNATTSNSYISPIYGSGTTSADYGCYGLTFNVFTPNSDFAVNN